MNNQDHIQNFIFDAFPIRGEIVHLQASFQQIMEQHDYPPLVRRWLGEALILISLLSSTIKFEGKLTLQFQGKTNLKLLIAECNHRLELRGLAQWEGDLSEAEILSSLKQGTLVLTMDPAKGQQRYQGIVAFEGETLAESIEAYFQRSEQVPTRIWVTVDEQSAAGFLLQRMPKDQEQDADQSPDHDWESITILTSTLTPEELSQLDNKTLLKRLYVEEDVRLFDAKPLQFKCTCSNERSTAAILTLGQEEAEEELKDKQELVVKCEFCNQEYKYGRKEVDLIFNIKGTSNN